MHFGLPKNRVNSVFFWVFVAALLIYPALQRKIQLQLWHLWNGDTTQLEQYDIPVPADWVAVETSSGTVTLLRIEPSLTRDEFPSTILIAKNVSVNDVNLASSLNEESLKSRGAQMFDRKTVEFDGEKAECLVSNSLIHLLDVPSDTIISAECESTARLSITFNGDKKNLDTLFAVVSRIRKHEDAVRNPW